MVVNISKDLLKASIKCAYNVLSAYSFLASNLSSIYNAVTLMSQTQNFYIKDKIFSFKVK